ncbi:MAG: flippase-like domain-containing protein [Candidatus Methanoperedens sp.]|nr:flippase-like domain-containing protein [Candidatus Methanoperedens sp.]MCZ7371221.1 flippase-like domain-containing protein [Candidatus Methanoperedens sp.]
MSKISIVVPAHNEEENLANLLGELLPVLEGHEETRDYELIIVNDNSTDRTPQIIETLADLNPRIKPVHMLSNPGFGNAIKEGFRNAKGDIIIPVMGDLSDDPEDIIKLVQKIEEGYDIAYGSRFIEGGRTDGYPYAKMIANRTFNNSVRLLFGIKHKDITNAFKAYRKEVLDRIGIDNLEANGFDLTVEIPLKAHIMGFTSAEVPVTWHGRKRGVAKLKLSENATKYGKRLVKLFIIGNIISLRDLLGSAVSGSKIKLLAALVFGVLVLIGIFSYSGYTQVYDTIKNASLYYVSLGFFAVSMAFFMRTWRWSVLLRTSGYVVPRDILFKSLMFGFFINYLIPARAGDIARCAALKPTEKIPMGASLATIVIERAMDMLTLSLLLSAGAMLVSKSDTMFFVATIALAVSILLVLMLIIVYRYDSFISRKLGKRFPAISGFMNTMKEGLYKIYSNPSALVLSIAISIPVWLFEISGVYIASLAIGYEIPFSLAMIAGITSFLGQTIPITPGGIGVYEGTMAGVLVLFGIPLSTGISLALVDHFIRASVTLIFGMISTIHLGFASREYFADMRQISHESDDAT